MNKFLIATLITLGFFLTSTLFFVGFYINVSNYGAKQESLLIAAQDNSKNILTQYSKKILEASQIPNIYSNKLIELSKQTLSTRYGKEGSKAMFQFIQEQNPTLDSKIYLNLQEIIESGRNDFQNSQTYILDIKRSYIYNLNTIVTGKILNMAGYPKINLKDFDVITSTEVDKTFSTKKDDTIIKLK